MKWSWTNFDDTEMYQRARRVINREAPSTNEENAKALAWSMVHYARKHKVTMENAYNRVEFG